MSIDEPDGLSYLLAFPSLIYLAVRPGNNRNCDIHPYGDQDIAKSHFFFPWATHTWWILLIFFWGWQVIFEHGE